jgi:hypothetical protein
MAEDAVQKILAQKRTPICAATSTSERASTDPAGNYPPGPIDNSVA